ncbi:MAG TPA: bifunctional riboflavin kinase/FAD synthetase [Rhodocyclaceae bacterium]|nr:bifunctional riboflavin kinase/FAD synthetase [Rhodocyclaceae bacterium]
MLVFRTIPERASSPTVLAIGNFDGLHLGHRALLERLTTKARELGLPASVMTFEPHPRELFSPEQAPARLTSLREKLGLIEACGVERTYVCHFSRKLSALTAEDFIEHLLVRGLGVRHLIIGDDFRFGRGRGGDFSTLQQAGVEHNFGVEAMHTIDLDGERVSSSAVREALAAGDLEHAARLLGRPYNISGRVVHGDKIGRRIGFPTANIQLKRKHVPLAGVFAVTVSGLDKRHLPGAASLGVRPTLGDGLKPVLEVHLLDFDREIYGAHVAVHFLHKLRDEAKYDSLMALTAQIERDVAQTRTYFAGGNPNG